MAETSRRIGLEVDEGQGPLHGRLADEGGPVHEFDGWLGLLTALGHLLDAPQPGGAPSPPSTQPE